MTSRAPFKFVDLFAGIGGFHAAGEALGGHCVYASEIDPAAAAVYERNWGVTPDGDLRLATEGVMKVPEHDVLFAGFPCQPFSKSGRQLGIDEARGTLFWNILRVVESRRPSLVLLENVRNLAGPRHKETLATIVRKMRELGYVVADKPLMLSPHEVNPSLGGAPQIRDRVYILAYIADSAVLAEVNNSLVLSLLHSGAAKWGKTQWNVRVDLPAQTVLSPSESLATRLTVAETDVINTWDDFVQSVLPRQSVRTSVGFPLWVDVWTMSRESQEYLGLPPWKRKIVDRNLQFYSDNSVRIQAWLDRHPAIFEAPASFRKLEWQAGNLESLWDAAIQFRPSGVRAKKMDYLPALVAMNQRSILGPLRRRVTVTEAAALQGFPEWFNFGTQKDSVSFKQLGNAVNIGVVYQVLRSFLISHAESVADQRLVELAITAPLRPFLEANSSLPVVESFDCEPSRPDLTRVRAS